MKHTPSERLLDRLRVELDLDISKTAFIERTYAGFYQRSAGAWVWVLNDDDRTSRYAGRLGSQWPVTVLLRAEYLGVHQGEYGDIDIFPKGVAGS